MKFAEQVYLHKKDGLKCNAQIFITKTVAEQVEFHSNWCEQLIKPFFGIHDEQLNFTGNNYLWSSFFAELVSMTAFEPVTHDVLSIFFNFPSPTLEGREFSCI